jgi:hypothetical protein
MPADLNRESSFADFMVRISHLPADTRVEALLDFFVGVLNSMDPATIRMLRDQLLERFATCGCSFETCVLMIEFIDIQLAFREAGRTDSTHEN